MSEAAQIISAIAALLWVAVGAAALVLLRGVLAQRRGDLSKLGIGPGGVTLEFAESKLEEAVRDGPSKGTSVGRVAKRQVATRLQRNADLLALARIVWVDDHPESNVAILDLLRSYGAIVDTPRTNTEALELLASARYDVIISDVARDDEGPDRELKGVELAQEVYASLGQRTLLFSAKFDPTTLPGADDIERLQLVRDLGQSVFARTNRMDEAVNYILDLLERTSLPT